MGREGAADWRLINWCLLSFFLEQVAGRGAGGGGGGAGAAAEPARSANQTRPID